MRLYLVQHGEAQPKEVDAERPLTEQGQAEVACVADALGAAGVSAARVIHSGKLRAGQTAEVLARTLAPKATLQINGMINPNDAPEAFAWQIDSWDMDTVVVGHLPFMARLVALLVTGDEERPVVGYRPGTIVCLERGDSGTWTIIWMLRPELCAHQGR